jgi:hypothetical protein
MRRVLAKVWRVARRVLIALAVIIVTLLVPVGYVELGCRGTPRAQTYAPLITERKFQRAEANTYLTYPEWHIVYAYDGMAEALKQGDEHGFNYGSSITGFWQSACALMRVADEHGGADWATRSTIHTTGVSFTAEMAVKAAYEETIGRATAWLRGAEKTAQDKAVRGWRPITPHSCARRRGTNTRSVAKRPRCGAPRRHGVLAPGSDGSASGSSSRRRRRTRGSLPAPWPPPNRRRS